MDYLLSREKTSTDAEQSYLELGRSWYAVISVLTAYKSFTIACESERQDISSVNLELDV